MGISWTLSRHGWNDWQCLAFSPEPGSHSARFRHSRRLYGRRELQPKTDKPLHWPALRTDPTGRCHALHEEFLPEWHSARHLCSEDWFCVAAWRVAKPRVCARWVWLVLPSCSVQWQRFEYPFVRLAAVRPGIQQYGRKQRFVDAAETFSDRDVGFRRANANLRTF